MKITIITENKKTRKYVKWDEFPVIVKIGYFTVLWDIEVIGEEDVDLEGW